MPYTYVFINFLLKPNEIFEFVKVHKIFSSGSIDMLCLYVYLAILPYRKYCQLKYTKGKRI